MSIVGSGDDVHFRLAAAIERAAEHLDTVATRCSIAPSAAWAAPDDANAVVLDTKVQDLAADAASLRTSLEWFATATRVAGFGYRETEQLVQEHISQTIQTAMHLLGILVRPAVFGLLAGAVGASVLVPAIDRLTQNSLVRAGLEAALRPVAMQLEIVAQQLSTLYGPFLESLLVHPTTLDLLGYGARGVDDFLLGVLGVPPVPVMSDNEAITLLATAMLPMIANGHRLGGSPVTPRDTSDQEPTLASTETVAGYAEGFEQIISQEHDIVIRTFELPDGTRHHQVFSQGTQNWSLGEEESGYDLLSNIENAASHGELHGTANGIRQAMIEAGISPDDTVDLFGYSQGGAAVALVAASGEFTVQSVTTYGAPSGQIEMPTEVDWVQIQIDQDLVANVAGMSQHRTNALLIEVSVDIDAQGPMDYHLAPAYEQALDQVEQSLDTVALRQVSDRAARLEGAVHAAGYSFELDR